MAEDTTKYSGLLRLPPVGDREKTTLVPFLLTATYKGQRCMETLKGVRIERKHIWSCLLWPGGEKKKREYIESMRHRMSATQKNRPGVKG